MESHIYKNGFLTEEKALKYFAQLLSAFTLLDQNNVLHWDIKPSNIMLNGDEIKIGDFGFCKPLKHEN